MARSQIGSNGFVEGLPPGGADIINSRYSQSRNEKLGNYPIERVIKANTCSQIVFRKVLDTIAIDTLYKTVRAIVVSRTVRKKLSMLTSRIYKEPVSKWQPCAAIYEIVCALSLSLSATNIGGRLGQETSIDSRHIRQ